MSHKIPAHCLIGSMPGAAAFNLPRRQHLLYEGLGKANVSKKLLTATLKNLIIYEIR